MVRLTDRPAMTIAVDLGRKATKQTNLSIQILKLAECLQNSNNFEFNKWPVSFKNDNKSAQQINLVF